MLRTSKSRLLTITYYRSTKTKTTKKKLGPRFHLFVEKFELKKKF